MPKRIFIRQLFPCALTVVTWADYAFEIRLCRQNMADAPNQFQAIYRDLLQRVAKFSLDGTLVERINYIPIELYRRDQHPDYRCCIYKERAITRYRLMTILGFRIEEEVDETKPLSEYAREALQRERPIGQPVITVLGEACRGCTPARYFVTNACAGCVARPCMTNCPKHAISRVEGKALIDPEVCINCGRCQQVCPYGLFLSTLKFDPCRYYAGAIIKLKVPCEEACPVGAISKGPSGKASVDFSKVCIGVLPFRR